LPLLVARRGLGAALRGIAIRRLAEDTEDGAGAVAVEPSDLPSELRWLPPINFTAKDETPSGAPGTMVLPLFPLGGVYLPNSEHEISIFEPRYRKMYIDILASGSRRFVVTNVHPEGDRFAEIGVVFYLTDLQDVSEMTHDEVKYICEHRVIGRVKINKVLNPSQWGTEDTYVRVETTPIEDDTSEVIGEEELVKKKENIRAMFKDVLKLHADHSGDRDDLTCELPAELGLMNMSSADLEGGWKLAEAWSKYGEVRLMEEERNFNDDVEHAFQAKGMGEMYTSMSMPDESDDEEDDEDDEEDDGEDLDMAQIAGMSGEDYGDMSVQALPVELQKDVRLLQERYQEEVDDTLDQQMLLFQGLLQSTTVAGRLGYLEEAILNERRRLAVRKSMMEAVRESYSKGKGKSRR